MSAFEALAAAKAAGVKFTLDGGDLFVEAPKLPDDVVEALRAVKTDLVRILELREAAKTAFRSEHPPDVRKERWAVALHGLRYFVVKGWGDQAALMGWSRGELYRVPALWSQIHLTGAALLIGDRKVVAVTEDNIVITTPTGSRLKFRRIGREHLA
jgi:hypothetical protein